MNTVTLSFNKYLEMLNEGALDVSASYEIEDNAQITNAHKLTLKDITFCGSVNIESDSSDIILQNCKITGDIICSATDAVIKKCTAHAISLTRSQNVLVAQNTSDAITLSGTQNCSAVLNNTGFISVSCAKNTYVIENTVSGDINLTNTAYLLCDGNKVGGKTENNGCTEYNGDNVRDVDARLEVGADENLLPHVDKDLFIDMPRREYVLQADYDREMTFNEYFLKCAEEGEIVIIPPAAYRAVEKIALSSAHANTIVYAYGAMRENVNYGPAIDIDAANYFSIRGLTIGYAKQSSGQVYVLEKLPDYKLHVVNAAGYDYGYGKTDLTKYSTSTEVFHPGRFTNWAVFGSPYFEIAEEREDKTFVIQLTKDEELYYNPMSVGEIWSCRMSGENSRTFYIHNAGNILFKDVTVYGYGAALGLVGYGTRENVHFVRVCNTSRSPFIIDKETYDRYKALEAEYNVNLEVSMDEKGRYRGSIPRTGSVDAMHISAGFYGVNATSCLFEHMCDDGANQHGASSRLHRLIDNGDGTTTLVYKGLLTNTRQYLYTVSKATEGTGANTVPFGKGDQVFCYTSNGRVVCDCEVIEGNTLFQEEKYHLLTWDYPYRDETVTITCSCYLYGIKIKTEDVNFAALEGYDLDDNTSDPKNRVIVDNVSRTSSFYTFDNVLVRHTRARGIAVKARNVTAKNCTFRDIGSSGIMISCEENWAENTVGVNTTVQKCLFDHTSQKLNFMSDMKFGSFAIEGNGGLSKLVKPAGDSYPCTNVLVEDCTFINNPHDYDIAISEAMNVTFRNNTFNNHVNENGEEFLGVPVKITTCLNVKFENNKFSPLSEGKIEKIFTVEDSTNVTNNGEVIS